MSDNNNKDFTTPLLFFVLLIFVIGFAGAIAITGVFGIFLAIFAPFILSFIFLKQRYGRKRVAFVVLVLQCIIGAFVNGMLIGKVSENGLLYATGIIAVVFTIYNFVRRKAIPYWKRKWN